MKGLGSPKLVLAAMLGALAGGFGIKPLQQQVLDRSAIELALSRRLKGAPGKGHGKGRGTPSRRYGNKAGAYSPHQGQQECARRRRQIKSFILQRENGLYIAPRKRLAA